MIFIMDDNLERLFINSKHVFIFAFIHSFVSQFDVHCLFYFACAHARVLPFMCNKYTEPWWQHTKIIYADFFTPELTYYSYMKATGFFQHPHNNKCYHSSAPLHKPGSCKIVNERRTLFQRSVTACVMEEHVSWFFIHILSFVICYGTHGEERNEREGWHNTLEINLGRITDVSTVRSHMCLVMWKKAFGLLF